MIRSARNAFRKWDMERRRRAKTRRSLQEAANGLWKHTSKNGEPVDTGLELPWVDDGGSYSRVPGTRVYVTRRGAHYAVIGSKRRRVIRDPYVLHIVTSQVKQRLEDVCVCAR